MRTHKNFFTIFIALILSLSCAGIGDRGKAGGPCSYRDFNGMALITEIKTIDNHVEVFFDFLPDDPNAPSRYVFLGHDKHISIKIQGVGYPDPKWISTYDIKVGSKFPVIRSDETAGSCTPLIYKFTTLDWAYA